MIPRPVAKEICAVCELDWDAHLSQVTEWVYDEDDPTDPGEEKVGDVTLQQCVRLLLRRFEGPPGPAGAMGARGMTGEIDWDSKRVRLEVNNLVVENITNWSLGEGKR